MSGLGLDQGQSRASKHSNMRRTGQFTSSWTRVNGAERGNAVVTKHRHDGALGTGKSGEGEHGSADGGDLHGCGWCGGGGLKCYVLQATKCSNDTTLAQFEEGCSFDIHCGLPGGKVHGSLSRAGKVKGQTPKVDKQDKKKSKTGRAKRRFQYNRRFVNVVQGFGKKRGPNSNQS